MTNGFRTDVATLYCLRVPSGCSTPNEKYVEKGLLWVIRRGKWGSSELSALRPTPRCLILPTTTNITQYTPTPFIYSYKVLSLKSFGAVALVILCWTVVCSKGMDKKKRSASTAGSLRPAMRRTPPSLVVAMTTRRAWYHRLVAVRCPSRNAVHSFRRPLQWTVW
jgi:hypothetical protein